MKLFWLHTPKLNKIQVFMYKCECVLKLPIYVYVQKKKLLLLGKT